MTRLDDPMSFKRLGGRTCHSCVSSAPSKIPYGGFSPVRLQAGVRPQPSSRTALGLYATSVQAPAAKMASCEASRPTPVRCSRSPGRSSPEALGSPAGCAVPPGRRLLWPHPSLSASPANLCLRPSVFALRPRPRGSPLLSACPSLRAASLTPADRSAALGCCWADRDSLHHLLTGSASARSTPVGSRVVASRGCRVRFMLRPGALLALHRPGLLHSSFRPVGHPSGASSITTWANNQFPRPDLHRLDTQPCGLRQKEAKQAKN